MRAKDNQIPEKCRQCKKFSECFGDAYETPWEDTAEWMRYCAVGNWFEWEDKLTKADFEVCP